MRFFFFFLAFYACRIFFFSISFLFWACIENLCINVQQLLGNQKGNNYPAWALTIFVVSRWIQVFRIYFARTARQATWRGCSVLIYKPCWTVGPGWRRLDKLWLACYWNKLLDSHRNKLGLYLNFFFFWINYCPLLKLGLILLKLFLDLSKMIL